MYTIRKLKPERPSAEILIPFFALAASALVGIFFGLDGAYIFLAAVFFVYAAYTLLTFVRTHNRGFIVIALFQITGGFVSALRLPGLSSRGDFGLPVFLSACMVLFLAWTILLVATKRVKWRGREVLELAAASVEQAQNGYTGRPLPVGKTELNQRQILEFADFARRNLIAVTYAGRDRIVLVPVPMGRETPFILGLKGDYVRETWVSFDFEGNVSANVAQSDYLEYREPLSFNKLCESLGNLFIEFAELVRRGEGVRVIDRLDAVSYSLFS
jgi:hypothetical protein